MAGLELKAYAKVNIGLDVLRRLENGYHQVRMIMQTISLYDTLILETCEEKGIFLTVDRDDLGMPEENLAYRAARLLMEEFHIEKGIHIRLQKRIPVAAGMAGGSSDAAAVLRGVNQLYGLGLGTEGLMERGVRLGADVPYCVVGGTYLSEGIGEILTPAARMPECFILAAKPHIQVSTKWVYEHLHANELTEHPDIDAMLGEIRGGSLSGLAACMDNVLERVTIGRYPVIQEIKETMEHLGALKAMMSGSGPTVFGLFSTRDAMHKAYQAMQDTETVSELFETTIVHEDAIIE